MRDKTTKVADERSAMIRCHQLVARFMPAWDGVNGSPVIDELLAAHAAVVTEMDRLRGTLEWPEVLAALTIYVRKYRLPILDGMRDRNGLDSTFGEQTVREIVQ